MSQAIKVNQPPFYGTAKREPKFHLEASGAEGGGFSGRRVHNVTGQRFTRNAETGNRWQAIPRSAP